MNADVVDACYPFLVVLHVGREEESLNNRLLKLCEVRGEIGPPVGLYLSMLSRL